MIKLTKKYFGRSKSPNPSRDDTSSITSSRTATFTTDPNEGDDSKSLVNKDHSDDTDRRKTIVPESFRCNTEAPSTDSGDLHGSSSTSTFNVSNQTRDSSPPDGLDSFLTPPFKPGILTVKVYSGNGFQIPFDLNFDRNLVSRLIQCSPYGQTQQDDLLEQLGALSIDDNRLSDDFKSSAFIPASITIPSSQQSPLKNALIYVALEFDKTIVTIDGKVGSIQKPTFNDVIPFDVTSSNGKLNFQVFLKLPSALLDNDNNIANRGQHNDILIASKTLDLRFANINNPMRLKDHEPVKLDNEYPGFNLMNNGEITISIDFKPSMNKHLTIDDFDLLKVIGKGSFGKVMQVRKKDSGKIYALKAIRKSNIIAKNEVIHTLSEKTVLANVNNPFIVPLKFSFQSPEKLYLVLSFINGGELFYHLQKARKFELTRARFYTCELLSALECLHNMNVIYRDLKPENILLDYKGHIALCDFGLCKLNMKNEDETKTFCGTPEYLAPELLLGTGYTKSVDWWTLGILLYEMLAGLPPYYDEDNNKMYQKILRSPLKFPDGMDRHAQDLLVKLLNRDPKYRLGSNGPEEIKAHPFFSSIDFRKLENKQYIPPFIPGVRDNFDTSNFDKEFTDELPVDSVVNEYLSDSVQRQFGGWTYVGTEHLGASSRE